MDPVTIALAIAFFTAIAIVVVVISIEKLVQWFKARSKIKASNKNAIAFTLAHRIDNKQYVEVPGVFDKGPTNTQIFQGFYDVETDEILDGRAIAHEAPPEDTEVQRLHDEGQGLVIYS